MATVADRIAKTDTASCALFNAAGRSKVVLVCEHASNFIPKEYGTLGLDADARLSHIAWDPGALAVARSMAEMLDARLVHGTVSRLVYDCNRAPDAPDCIPAQSEIYAVPGNQGLSDTERAHRVKSVYRPFHQLLADTLSATSDAILVTIHSFTPIYHGKPRATAIGILHDDATELADAMMNVAEHHLPGPVERNQPYGPPDGVTHTLQEHGLKNDLLNVMIEIRNTLISNGDSQVRMAKSLVGLLREALANLDVTLQTGAKA